MLHQDDLRQYLQGQYLNLQIAKLGAYLANESFNPFGLGNVGDTRLVTLDCGVGLQFTTIGLMGGNEQMFNLCVKSSTFASCVFQGLAINLVKPGKRESETLVEAEIGPNGMVEFTTNETEVSLVLPAFAKSVLGFKPTLTGELGDLLHRLGSVSSQFDIEFSGVDGLVFKVISKGHGTATETHSLYDVSLETSDQNLGTTQALNLRWSHLASGDTKVITLTRHDDRVLGAGNIKIPHGLIQWSAV